MSAERSFFFELRRRNVLRAGVLYIGAVWALAQGIAQLGPPLGAPGWIVRWFVIAAAIGFPFWVVFTWFYEFTPRGLQRESEAPPTAADARRTGRKLDRAIIAVLAIAVALLLTNTFVWHEGERPQAQSASASASAGHAGHTAATLPAGAASAKLALPQTMAGLVAVGPKSIAVLPFENMSADPNNRYFAEGMQDMILTRLADIGDLKVISRTSTEQYASHPDNLKVVARQLAVANILEGSVQKVGNQVLINVQLIDARTDSHIWAQAYTRTLDNIFGVEGEVAEKIAQALHATLTEREQQTLAVKPTQNVDAYNAYLHGLASSLGAGGTAEDYRRTAGFYAEAVRRDPDFALAWARLSETDSSIYQLHYDHSKALAAEAKHAADTALKLAPDSGEAWLARGIYFSRVESNYANAIAALTQARTRLPNSGEVLGAFADVEARQGQWDSAIANIDQASVFDPRNTRLLLLHVRIHAMRREFKFAAAVLAHARAVAPGDISLIACEASLAQALGRLDDAQTLLAPLPLQPDDPSVFKAQIMQFLYRHQYAEASRALQTALSRPEPSLGGDIGDYYYLAGFVQHLADNAAGAHSAWLIARDKLEAMQRASPDEPEIAADLGLVYAGLGDKARALAQGKRAVQLQPASTDATLGPAWQEQLARIEAQTGEKERAIADLRHLLQTPYRSAFYGTAITPSLLRQDPTWNPLRDDPRFQALLKEFHDTKPTSAAMSATHG